MFARLSGPAFVLAASTCVTALVCTAALAQADPPARPASTAGSIAAEEHPLAPALRIARECLETAEAVKDFDASFSKRDVVDGEVFAHTMRVKFRAEPFSVYMRFAEPHDGREVIYVEGRNENKLLAHEPGLLSLAGTIELDPLSDKAMSESRHPITNMGLLLLVDGVIKQWESELPYGEIEVKYYPNAKLRSMQCRVIESVHPRPRRQFKFHKTRLFIDSATNLPVRVEQYGFPVSPGEKPPLLEEYTYWNIRPNAGLTDRDFNPENPEYGY
jgi:hypothetical protein